MQFGMTTDVIFLVTNKLFRAIISRFLDVKLFIDNCLFILTHISSWMQRKTRLMLCLSSLWSGNWLLFLSLRLASSFMRLQLSRRWQWRKGKSRRIPRGTSSGKIELWIPDLAVRSLLYFLTRFPVREWETMQIQLERMALKLTVRGRLWYYLQRLPTCSS